MRRTTCSIPVRYADTDAQGVVFFANFLTYMDEAATAHLEQIGLPYTELRELGIDFVYASAKVDYRDSLRHGDSLEVDCAITRIGRTSLTTQCVLRVGERVCAEGELVQVCIGEARDAVPVPDRLRELTGLG